VQIFLTKDRGWGVHSKEPIPQGTFIIEYAGMCHRCYVLAALSTITRHQTIWREAREFAVSTGSRLQRTTVSWGSSGLAVMDITALRIWQAMFSDR